MSPNSTHLDRWLGTEKIEQLAVNMRGWYGPPIAIADVPGEVWVAKDGDFHGRIDGGEYYTGLDAHREARLIKRKAALRLYGHLSKQGGMAGFTSLSDLMSEATVSGKMQPLGGSILKNGTTGVIGSTNSLFVCGSSPATGAAAGAAPGGTVPTSASAGALGFTNPPSGDLMYVTGADISQNAAPNSLLLYSRIFAVAVNPNTVAAQSVTGVPTLYQNTTGGAADSIAGNFMFFDTNVALAATAHNITFTYRDQANNVAEVAPVVAGLSGCIDNRLNQAAGTWFNPLNGADTGIKVLTDVTMSAAVATGAFDAVIGHPHCWMVLPSSSIVTPFDWVFQRFAPSRVFNDACLALLEVNKGTTTNTNYTGTIMAAWG